MSISTNPVGKVWVENMFLWLGPLLLFVYKMLYEYLPFSAFLVCLILPGIYLYRVTKDLSPAEAVDELNKRNRQAEEMWEELTKEEEAEEEEKKKAESKQKKKKQQSFSQSQPAAAATHAESKQHKKKQQSFSQSAPAAAPAPVPATGGKKTKKQAAAAARAAAEEEEDDMLSRMAQQRSKKAMR